MKWQEGDNWCLEVDLFPGITDFKCAVVRPDGSVVAWEPGANRTVEVRLPLFAAVIHKARKYSLLELLFLLKHLQSFQYTFYSFSFFRGIIAANKDYTLALPFPQISSHTHYQIAHTTSSKQS